MRAFLFSAAAASAVAAHKESEWTFSDLSGKFEEFKKEYNRQYSSEGEELKRFKLFTQNLEKSDKFNKMDAAARYGHMSPFADMSESEFQQRLGFKVTEREIEEHERKAVAMKETNPVSLPSSFDWRDKGAVTSVKNQGQCGSCWSFATVASIEGAAVLTGHPLVSLSEQELVDCDSVDQGCNGGLPSNAYKYLLEQKMGLEKYDDYSYSGSAGSCKADKGKELVFLSGWQPIPQNEDLIAAALMKYGPLAIGLNAMWMQMYTGGISDPWLCNPKSLDHGVTLVAFGEEDGKPFWSIKNSWGPGWGEKGYYRLVRGKGKCGMNLMVTGAEVAKGTETALFV